MAEYYATVQYQKGTELTNTELKALRDFASLYHGSPHEVATNPDAEFIAFTFGQEEDAKRFADVSKNIEKIVQVKVGELRRSRKISF